MQHRTLLGWLLVGAFWVSVSCSGGSSGGGAPRGFGIACSSDKDCTAYKLLCGSGTDTCVQCLAEDDCKVSESCEAGLCKTPQACEDSRDCANDQVCNETAGVCVACLLNRDCESGQKCADHNCVDEQACDYTSDCDPGLRCDPDSKLCVSCLDDDDCPARRVCTAGECVSEGSGGTGGSGTAGNSNGGSAMGGKNTGGNSGSGGTAGTAGTAGNAGSNANAGEGGGGPVDCDCLASEVCTADLRCVSPNVIDDFVDCDKQILEIEGRTGAWYGDADTDVDITFGVSLLAGDWVDKTCAAWATGGTQLNGINDEFAIVSAILNDGSVYDLSSYTGLQVKLESDNPVELVISTSAGYFRYVMPGGAGSTVRTVPFTSVLHETVTSVNVTAYLYSTTEIQFAATDRASFGFAVHSVTLY